MVQIIAGEKGEGKTKRLIDLANTAGKQSNGHVVFIDDDNRHMYDLHYGIRFVDTSSFILGDHKIFLGFISGILSQDRDIEKIFIDGLNNIVKKISMDEFVSFVKMLNKLSTQECVDFTMIISMDKGLLPAEVSEYLI
ncbi:MAG: twitching motility protein PilT [Lachnospiraceae bacterium]|nr:twitching motility protein PilT [Lachnospiraceae bacterium]